MDRSFVVQCVMKIQYTIASGMRLSLKGIWPITGNCDIRLQWK